MIGTCELRTYRFFVAAAHKFLRLSFVSALSYPVWQQFNLICDGKTSGIPDRVSSGALAAVASNFFGNLQHVKGFVTHFYLSSAQFMNLCDDLQSLAGMAGRVDTDERWNSLVGRLTWLVKNDASTDWSKPALAALFKLCSGTEVTTNVQQGRKSMTCTITVS